MARITEHDQQFNYRIGNIEARTLYDRLEIVQWNAGACWVIVSFEQSGDPLQWHAMFVGMRPLDKYVNWQHLRCLIQAGYDFLNGQEYGSLTDA